jgi:putative hydroxymethylpyrimidine transport system permease protein
MDASFWQKLRLLHWPWALPSFFAGLKMAVAVATIGAVIGEWVGAQKGLGYLMIQMNARLRADMVFASILWLTLIGMGLWGLVGLVENKVLYWKKEG